MVSHKQVDSSKDHTVLFWQMSWKNILNFEVIEYLSADNFTEPIVRRNIPSAVSIPLELQQSPEL